MKWSIRNKANAGKVLQLRNHKWKMAEERILVGASKGLDVVDLSSNSTKSQSSVRKSHNGQESILECAAE